MSILPSLLGAFFYILRYKGIAFNQKQIFHNLAIDIKNISELDIDKIADHLGFKVTPKEISLDKLDLPHFPVIATINDNEAVILVKKTDNDYLVQDLQSSKPKLISHKEFEDKYSGKIYFVTPKNIVADALRRFDIKWFIPVIKK